MFSGYILLNKESLGQRLNKLFFTGFLFLFLGDLVQWFFPLNKNLWSIFYSINGRYKYSWPSCFDLLFDLNKSKYKFRFAHVFGVNSIFAYSLSSMLTIIFYNSKWIGVALNSEFMRIFENIGFPMKLGSLIYAIFYVIILWMQLTIFIEKEYSLNYKKTVPIEETDLNKNK